MSNTTQTPQDFIEKYYPNYHSSSGILRLNDLEKIMEDEDFEQDENLCSIFHKELNADFEKVQFEIDTCLKNIYEEAIKSFLLINKI